MNKTITNIVISVLLFSITVVFDSCSTKREIKVITKPDTTYLSENYELAEIKDWNLHHQDRYKIGKFLYFSSNHGSQPFNYDLYVNEHGYVDKILVRKSLSNKIDKEFTDLISKQSFLIAIKNNKPVKHVVNYTEEMFEWIRNRKKIKITETDDKLYVESKRMIFGMRTPVDSRYINKVYAGPTILFRYYEEQIAKEVGSGEHIFIYKYFINEDGEIDKIKIIKGIGSGLDEKVLTESVALRYDYFLRTDEKIKSFITLQYFIDFEKNKIKDITYNYFYQNIDYGYFSKKIANHVKLLTIRDTAYTQLEYTDFSYVNDYWHRFFLNSIQEEIKTNKSKFKEYGNAINYRLFINESGMLDKAQVLESLGNDLDNVLLNKIKQIVFSREYVKSIPVNYSMRVQIVLSENSNPAHYYAYLHIYDDRQKVYNSRFKFSGNEKDFEVLPDILPSPVGGIEAIQSKVTYPEIAKYHGIEEKIVIKCYIDTDGTPLGVQVLRAAGFNLENTAIDAIMSTTFTPGIDDGKKVKSILVLPFEYKLKEPGVRISRKGLAPLPSYPVSNIDIKSDEFTLLVDENPFPVGGMKTLQKNISYPEVAKLNKVQGKVLVKAYIDEEGNVLNTELIKGIGSGCDEAAMEAIKRTKFHPAKIQGEPVKVQISIPIVFNLK